jgi:hypothetical protein
MLGQADDDLLAAIQAMAETQQQMLRRQLATEQVFRDVRDKVTQALDVASDVKLLKYQIERLTIEKEQLFGAQRTQGIRLLLAYLTNMIVLIILGVPLVLLLIR